MFANEHDTIFAPASGAGRAAIAVLRISGPDCAEALAAIAPGAEFPDRRAILRTLRHPHSREPLDRGLITRFQAPRSFTGEEMAEIGVTGGRAVVAALVKALALIPGMRLAEPGEFAWRAFMNGKIDLSEAEGLADLVEAETEAQRRQAQRIAGGALGRECEAIRASLLDAMAAVETQIDFSDVEDSSEFTLRTVKDAARAAIGRIDRALLTADKAQRLRDGFTVVIAGPPNAGKSTLMNALAGRDVAIVSAIPGTTRDLIEVFLDLRGYPVILVDTAGIRESGDPIEREGVARARRRAEAADLTLWLNDGSGGEAPGLSSPILTVRTKIDLEAGSPQGTAATPGGLAISAKTGAGVDRLLDVIAELAEERMASSEPALLTLERHRRAFLDARDALDAALAPQATEPELIAEDLRRAAGAMDRVVGRISVEEVLGEIFARLCVGK
ncbi:MAG TPA: tRNA uridine-5-carboxymethylaminomethyl(34) synthesis GTPase MnmE [Roseiarcus sp.]|nr:tRNA uridine-5-carboxymethylaminomethyl(34) synthesis GTPase MnmE [Roseiarcus sp.]